MILNTLTSPGPIDKKASGKSDYFSACFSHLVLLYLASALAASCSLATSMSNSKTVL